MRRTFQFALILFLGIIIGLYIYARFAQQTNVILESDHEDSLMAADLQAQEINQEITLSRQNAITRAVQEISPAVVSVNVMQVQERIRHSPFKTRDPLLREFFPEFFQDRKFTQEITALGSGFLISNDGYILTNDHVIENARKIMITMVGGDSAEAEIIGKDFISDIALLKINEENLPYIKLGDSDKVLLGEWAIAVGNPFGLFEISNYPTVTVGVVSAIKRDFGEIGESRYRMRIYPNMIQTDASINHGNSGGPLCNALGEAIGMNTFIYTESPAEGSVGIGFAVPVNRIKAIISDLKQLGKVNRDIWIGIKVKDLTERIAQKNNFRNTDGAMVTHIEMGSPADKAGIHLEDIIIGVEEKKVKNSENLSVLINMMDPIVGDTIQLSLLRDQKEVQVTLYLTSRE